MIQSTRPNVPQSAPCGRALRRTDLAGGGRGAAKTAHRRECCLDDPCFGGKAPNRIEAMDLIDRTRLYLRRIGAVAQRRRNTLHDARRYVANITLSGAVD